MTPRLMVCELAALWDRSVLPRWAVFLACAPNDLSVRKRAHLSAQVHQLLHNIDKAVVVRGRLHACRIVELVKGFKYLVIGSQMLTEREDAMNYFPFSSMSPPKTYWFLYQNPLSRCAPIFILYLKKLRSSIERRALYHGSFEGRPRESERGVRPAME